MKFRPLLAIAMLAILLTSLLTAWAPAAPVALVTEKVAPLLLQRIAAEGHTEYYVIMAEQADVSAAATLPTKQEKTAYVFKALTAMAQKTQKPLLSYLAKEGVSYESMYIQNMIKVDSGLTTLTWLSARPEVAKIVVPPTPVMDPVIKQMTPEQKTKAIEWNIVRIGADDVWTLGFNGDGLVLASNDTGVEYNHPALVNHYRGTTGPDTYDHNFNWWDGTTGYDYPHDYDGHGTHTTGTMVGDDGLGNQVGVAPGAQWIACPGIGGGGTDTVECFEFFLAPWDLNRANANSDLAPDAINNSWYDPSGYDYRTIIQNLNAAGIAVIKSAGNQGSGCSTISNPGYVPEIISTANFAQGDTISSSSSRGPSSYYGDTILKPEVAAPGTNIRSSVPGGVYEGGWSGTSMAAPHTTALIALMWEAAPCLRGDVPTTKTILQDTADEKIDAQCVPHVGHPNNVWGYGILDSVEAVETAIAYCGGLGTLDGTVTDANTSNPLEGAAITAVETGGFTRNRVTDSSGYYTADAVAGTYTVTASLYGYVTASVSGVAVVSDTTTTQNFALVPAETYTLSGVVTDSVSSAPLQATITLLDTPLAPVTSDPGTGAYTIDVPAGTYTLQAAADGHMSLEMEITISADLIQNLALDPVPCILLVDDDANNTFESYYTSALDGLGLDYALWSTSTSGSPSLADMADYRMVFWFTGNDYQTTLSTAEETALAAYLDQGGNFFLSSQDYLYDVGSSTTFDTTYLQVQSFTNDVSNNNPVGVAGDPIGDGLGDYTLTVPSGFGTLYADNVVKTAAAGVTNPFKWNNNAYYNSTSYTSGTFKTVFLTWPIEGLAGLADRQDVLGAVVSFFGGCPSCEPIAGVAFTFSPIDPDEDETITFTGTATSATPVTYNWNFGNGDTGTGNPLDYTYVDPGEYTVTLTANNGCTSATAMQTVTVLDICEPITAVDFSWLPANPVQGTAVAFTPMLTGGDGLISYTWDFGDGGTSSQPNPSHTFFSGGDYTVALTASNACSSISDSQVVAVGSIFDLFLPVVVK